jgi:hypothetical protein
MGVSVVYPLTKAIYEASGETLASEQVSVYFGMPVTDDPGYYLVIGVADPDDQGYMDSGLLTQDWASMGARSRDQTGQVPCAISTWNGDGDLNMAMSDAHDLLGAVEQMCRANPAFGVDGVLWTSCNANEQWSHAQFEKGLGLLVFFTIGFRARL